MDLSNQLALTEHDADWETNSAGPHTCADGAGNPDDTSGNGDTTMDMGDVTVGGWSSSSNGSDTVTISVASDVGPLDIDDSIILVLEDDFAAPDSIPLGVVYFRQQGPSGGARVYASVSVDSEDDDHAGDDAHTIQIYVPDMNPADDRVAGLTSSRFDVVIPKAAGIKNPGDAKN